MYAYLKGTVAETGDNTVIMDVGGIGYELFVSSNTSSSCRVGEERLLYTYLSVKEDEMSLFAFADKSEKTMFLHLISISGIGPKLALSVLGGMKLQELIRNIVTSNNAALSGIKGVGKKTAERIVVELKDKLSDDFDGGATYTATEMELTGKAEEAVSVLVALGFKREAAVKSVNAVSGNELTVNQIVHKAING